MSEAIQIPQRIPPELVFEFDIYHDPRVTEDVQQSYAFLHDAAPDVFWTPLNGGHWVITRAEKINQIVTDPEHFSASHMQILKVEGGARDDPSQPKSARQSSLSAGSHASVRAKGDS